MEEKGQSPHDRKTLPMRIEMPTDSTSPFTDRRWFATARFGMFLHWGVYSVLARGEWVMYKERIPVNKYAAFADQFNPKRWQPSKWVALAEETGMRYMVLTVRHHDGFCLFDSEVSDFTSAKTAAGRDLIVEYVEACRSGGLRVGLYYSLVDWRLPACRRGPEKDPKGWAVAVEYAHAQVRELCTNYGKIDLLWFDGGGPSAEAWQAEELNAMVHKLQPGILVNNRSGLPGDFDTPEQHIVVSEKGRMWESCMTMNDSWGYSASDRHWKSAAELVHTLATCAHNNGNLLLNIGPKADGSFPVPARSRLRQIGRWMAHNGESIHGTWGPPFAYQDQTISTAKGYTAYIHIAPYHWPGESKCIAGIKNKVKSARVLSTGQDLRVAQKADRLFLTGMPVQSPDPVGNVIALELHGQPEGWLTGGGRTG